MARTRPATTSSSSPHGLAAGDVGARRPSLSVGAGPSRPRGLGTARRLHPRARPQARRRVRDARDGAPRLRSQGMPEVPTQVPAGRVDPTRPSRTALRARSRRRPASPRSRSSASLQILSSSSASTGLALTRAMPSTPWSSPAAPTRGSTPSPARAWTPDSRSSAAGCRSTSVHPFGGKPDPLVERLRVSIRRG